MTNVEVSMAAAKRLTSVARKLVILGDGNKELKFSTDKTVVSLSPSGLEKGNISIETGVPRISGRHYVHSTFDLNILPRSTEDVNRMKIAASILESYLTSI